MEEEEVLLVQEGLERQDKKAVQEALRFPFVVLLQAKKKIIYTFILDFVAKILLGKNSF